MAESVTSIDRLLNVGSPWQIGDVQLTTGGRRVDIWIVADRGRSWFGRGQRLPSPSESVVWRHSNLCGMPCYIHVPMLAVGQFGDVPWAGDAKIPFTYALRQEILTLLAEGVSFQSVCKLLDLPLTDLWKYKYAFERGQAEEAQGGEAQGGEGGGLPDVEHIVWESLLDGRIEIDVHTLSLKLLITRLRAQFKTINDPGVRQIKVRELHRYFERHRQALGGEIAQLRHHQQSNREITNV